MPSLKQQVDACPRCGDSHEPLEFIQFTNHSGSADWSHYAFCPSTGEPICLRYAGGDYMPGVSEMESAHAEWAAEIRAIANGTGSPIDKLHRINESLDRAGVPVHKEPGQ